MDIDEKYLKRSLTRELQRMWTAVRKSIIAGWAQPGQAACLAASFVWPLLFVLYIFWQAAAPTGLEVHAFNSGTQKRTFTHLVMVAGHSVYLGRDYSDATNNSNWYLLDYQRVPGQAASFVEHIRMGVQIAGKDPQALLVFSGGYTRAEAGALSEAGSYWRVADALDWFSEPSVRPRALVEDRARDSWENLLFSFCKFRQFSGRYPGKVTIVSFDFKRHRFIHVHGRALGMDPDSFEFVGTPALDPVGAEKGERSVVEAFGRDPYSCQSALREKKRGRDPFRNGPPDSSTCPELKVFMAGRCLHHVFHGALPWRTARSRRQLPDSSVRRQRGAL